MHIRLKRVLFSCLIVAALVCLFCFSASAFTYEGSVNDVNLSTYSINIGGTVLPLSKYPDGSVTPFSDTDNYYSYMTVSEAKEYGINLSSNLWLRSAECMAFARYVYAALYYKYPATATMDNYIASTINPYGSYSYVDMISSPWTGGTYTAADFASLIKSCYPGSFIRQGGHSMVIMSIFDDGLIVYDANGMGNYNEVDVRKYTWQGYINVYGSRSIYALQTPSYYPGYTDSLGRTGGGAYDYNLDITKAGKYQVVNVDSYLKIRSGPSATNSIVGKAYSGDQFDVLGTYNGWAAVVYNGAACWLSLDYLEVVALNVVINGYTLDTSTAGTYQVNSPSLGYLNVRALPSSASSSAKKGTLAHKSVIQVLGTYNVWAAIEYNGNYCWVHTDYLTPYVPKITVTFDANGGTSSQTTGTYQVGATFGSLPTATKSQRTLMGWYYNGSRYTANSTVPSGDITLTAKWSLYSFTDVDESAWYAPAVKYVYDNAMMNGYSDTSFGPEDTLTRAMMAQILYNLANKPAVTSTAVSFTDVPSSEWYYDAVQWAAENGLVLGRGDGIFDPDSVIKRQEMVTMIWRYVFQYLKKGSDVRGDLSVFSDYSSILSYAVEAMEWAVGEGIVNGMGDGIIAPDGVATRGQIAKILMEYFS